MTVLTNERARENGEDDGRKVRRGIAMYKKETARRGDRMALCVGMESMIGLRMQF